MVECQSAPPVIPRSYVSGQRGGVGRRWMVNGFQPGFRAVTMPAGMGEAAAGLARVRGRGLRAVTMTVGLSRIDDQPL